MDSYNDEELLYLMHCGSETAQRLLLENYYHKIRKWLISYVGYDYLGFEIDDLVQTAIVFLVQSLDSYRDDKETSLNTFLKIVVVRKIHSFLLLPRKRHKKSQMIYIPLDAYVNRNDDTRFDELIGDPSIGYQPEKQLMIQETKSMYMNQFTSQASDIERQVMMYIDLGYTKAEIAKEMNISLKSVYNAAYRASQKRQPLTAKNKCDKL